MKAVKQIIGYLRGRGLLSREHLIELASGGFLRWDEVYDGDPPDESPEVEETPSGPDIGPEDEYETLFRPRTGARKGKGGHHKVPVLEPAAICGRLAAQFDSWRGPLAGLVQVGRRLAACDTWEEAVVVLRNAAPDDLSGAVAEGLQEQSPTLPLLWQALSLEEYRALLDDPSVHGAAVSAYRAILAIHDHSSLGKHVWLLREREVADIFNLKQTQRHVLGACGRVFQSRPELIAALLRRDFHPPAYWAFVLLYSAQRGQPGDRPLPASHEHRPVRGVPTDAALMQAWAQALAMNPDLVAPFLFEYNVLQSQRLQAVSYALRRFAACLTPQERELIDLYFGKGLLSHQIATQNGISDAEVEQSLHALRQALGEALEVSSSLQIPLCAAPASTRDAFIEDCLRWGLHQLEADAARGFSDSFQEVIKAYFGPTADLLCPRSWD
jgi:hypothetical protein